MGWQERLWAKVDKSGDCWQWLGGFDRHGYGRHWHTEQGDRRAHRLAYELVKGSIPDGLTLDHLCRNKWCVNPDHLEAVTAGVNVLRGDTPAARNAAKRECWAGHPFDERNTHVRADGRRECRACMRDRMRARRAS